MNLAVSSPVELAFNVYGYRFLLRCSDPDVRDAIAADFAHFHVDTGADAPAICLEIERRAPDYSGVPPKSASVYTPRNIAISDKERTWIDYSGRALAVYDRRTGSFRIRSLDADLLYEASYLFLLSRIGEFLDGRAMHRLHALALSLNGRAILVVLPMGGGKSTLAASLLREPDVRFLSDDSPFIARDGRVHAFPLRIGLLPDAAGAVPPARLRRINRMEFGPKLVVDYDFFRDRVVDSAEPGLVFLGSRNLTCECRVEEAGRMESYRAMAANCVIGLGLFQGLEFVLHRSAFELAAKSGAAFSRLRNCRALLGRSRVLRLSLGRDRERNAEVVLETAKRFL